jgi:hypothetical protein
MGPCKIGVRVVGAVHIRPRSGDSLVLLRGADGSNGLHSLGGRVGNKVIVAIQPTSVVLRDASGRECWIEMSTAHAREVAAHEMQLDERASAKKARDKKAAARRNTRAQKKR